MEGYEVVVVGAGLVGEEMVKVLKKRAFPASSITVLARSERKQVIDGQEYQVLPTAAEAFEGKHIAFFAGTEGEKGASQLFGWQAVELVAREVQHFQRIGEAEDRVGKGVKAGGKIKAADAGQFATFELFQGMHAVLRFPC